MKRRARRGALLTIVDEAETSYGKIRLQTKRASVMEGRVVVIGGSFDPELSAHVGGDDRHYHVL